MKITYLDHSGFSVETERLLLVFDEYNPKPDANGCGIVTAEQVEEKPNSLLLLSHSHSDHWCREVTQLPFGDILLSEDFPNDVRGVRMKEGDVLKVQDAAVRAFGSTDMGISFLVDAEGKRIFHAGDYNLWHWEDESTQQEINEATEWFERILKDLAPYAGTIDLAFFPLDPRMGKNTARGIERFMEVMQPGVVIPMHCQNDHALPEGFAAAHENVIALTVRGQTAEL